MINHLHPTRRDHLTIMVAKYAVLYAARNDDDDRGPNEFIADGLIEEGLFFA